MKPQEQTLWDRISQVADNMRDLPSWKKGSPVNERCDSSNEDRTNRSSSMSTEPLASRATY